MYFGPKPLRVTKGVVITFIVMCVLAFLIIFAVCRWATEQKEADYAEGIAYMEAGDYASAAMVFKNMMTKYPDAFSAEKRLEECIEAMRAPEWEVGETDG